MATAATTSHAPATRTDRKHRPATTSAAYTTGLLRRLVGLELAILLTGAIAVSV